jgi:hypothetical protein
MFKKSKYNRNEAILYLYQTAPHTFEWGSLVQIFESSIKLIKLISLINTAIAEYSV